MSYNAFLINTGSKLILIDTGSGGKLDDQPEFHGAGPLLKNLRGSGYQPEQIDEVYITHRGQDHIGGLTIGSERAFPNVVVRAPKSEMDLPRSGKDSGALARTGDPDTTKAWIEFTKDLFERYITAENSRALMETSPSRPVSVRLRPVGTHPATRPTLSKARDTRWSFWATFCRWPRSLFSRLPINITMTPN